MSRNNAAQALAEMDRRHSLHPWTHFESFNADGPLVISSGDGCYLTDADGNRYMDAVGGLWCTQIGLGRDEMADAIADQVRKLAFSSTFTDMTNETSALLVGKLAEISPGDLNHIHYTTGGSTAIDSALRMVHYYQTSIGKPTKSQVIARDNSYHGSTYAAMSVGKRDGDHVPEFRYLDIVHHVSCPHVYRRPEGEDVGDVTPRLAAELEAKILEIGPDNIGGFFAEPIQASGGVIVPPDDYLAAMKAVCEKYDILFIADEVVTGFGRIGHWFASFDEFGVQPDIICSAKGLSSGYLPIGAMIYTDRIHEVISGSESGWYTSGFTYAGHPVSCAAALKNIEIIERENLLQNAKDVGQYFEDRLATLNDLPIVGNVRGRKLIACVENVKNKETKELFDDDINIGKRISNAAEKHGLMVRPLGHLNVMSPPIVITREQVDEVVETLGKSIMSVTDDLVREGLF